MMNYSGLKLQYLLFILLYIGLCLCGDVTERCKDLCVTTATPGEASTTAPVTCNHGNPSCRPNQCGLGCTLWRSALPSSCLDVCINAEIHSLEVDQCVSGCNTAVDIYINDMDDLLGDLSSPVLVAGSKTNDTVILDWARPSVSNVTFILQKKYVNLSEQWEQHPTLNWQSSCLIRVHDLRPYVTYKFRMVIVVAPQHTLFSPESVPIATDEYGPPSGEPNIISLSTTSSSIHLKWMPPYFLNARLLGYTLTTTAVDEPDSERIKEIDAVGTEIQSQVITILRPDTRYIIKVAARNRFGIGPTVEKPAQTKPRHTAEGTVPFLLLAADNKIMRQEVAATDMFDNWMLYELSPSTITIKGMAMHYERHQAYFVDSEGVVRIFPVDSSTRHQTVTTARSIYRSDNSPRAMSIDWLNNYLYMAEDNQISRCSIENENCSAVVIVTNLTTRPDDMSVDPCNGYLFWVQQGHEGGLYRVDLAELNTTTPINRPIENRIVKGHQLTAFTVDYPNFRIFFPDETRNTMKSVYLDGTDLRDIRETDPQNMGAMQFLNVHSMAIYNGILYWTNGHEVFFEEYDPNTKQFFHNAIFISGSNFTGLNIWHSSSQPQPVPLMPPKRLEILFSARSARLTWKEPEVDQGQGAWHSWMYEVEEVNHFVFPNASISGITERTLVVSNLVPGRLYSFRARAYSQGGYGPWSVVVNGTTIIETQHKPLLLYVDNDKVFSINLDGTDQKIAYNMSQYNNHLIDVETYNDLTFFSLSNGSVLMKTGNQPIKMLDIQGASVLAYDWLADTLYWSSPKHNMIQRRMLNADHHRDPETIYQGALSIEDIVLDSEEGFVYWTTAYTIEMSRLSGRGHHIIHNLPRFSGRYILGLAIDLQADVLYWVLKNGEKVVFFHMGLLHQDEVVDPSHFNMHTESSFERQALFPSLQYHSSKLFWVSGPGTVAVQDLRGKSVADLTVMPSSGLTAMTIVHDGKGHRPGSKITNKTAVPPAINLNTIRLNSRGVESFMITWSPVYTADGKSAFYDVVVEYENEPSKKKKVDYANITINYMEPYTNFTLTIIPCTEWGCNYTRPNEITLCSPESEPTVPTRPRKYVTYHRHYMSSTVVIEVEFRWSKPARENGKIEEYKVSQANELGGEWRPLVRLAKKKRYHTINQAKPNTTYYFKVCACTSVGCGPWTDPVQVNTADEKPVPMLLVLDSQMLGKFYVDDNNYERNLAKGHIVSLTFIAQEDTFYWINNSKQIVRMNGLNNTGEERILDTETPAKGLTADWIGRNLYWLEDKPAEENQIMKYSLSQEDSQPSPVLKRQATLWQVAVDPYKSFLFWTEFKNGSNFLMKCRLDGSDISAILWHHNSTTSSLEYRYLHEDRLSSVGDRPHHRTRGGRRIQRETCNCPGIGVNSLFVMDHTQPADTEIYVIDNSTGSIWATDENGCKCRLVVDALLNREYGLPPDSLTVDFDRLYWTTKAKPSVNSVLKATGADFLSEAVQDSPRIMAYGKHLQPMPDPKCLLVGNYSEVPQTIRTSNTSMTVVMKPWTYDASCVGISLPAIKYTLLYRPMAGDNDSVDCIRLGDCTHKGSYDPKVTLDKLRPDTLYQVQGQISNIYTQPPNYPSRPSRIRTEIGIPTAPRSVKSRVMNPHCIELLWQQPEFLNGPKADIIYVIEWSFSFANGTASGGNKVVKDPSIVIRDGDRYFESRIDDLEPDTEYDLRMLAYGARGDIGYSTSPHLKNRTFLLPANVVATSVNSTTVELQWAPPADASVIRHNFCMAQSSEPNNPVVISHPEFTNVSHLMHKYLVTGLEANREYYFSMMLVYRYNDLLKTSPVACITPVGPPSRPDATTTKSTATETLVLWNEPYDGGAPIEAYILEYRLEDSYNWTQVYNGSSTEWAVNLPIRKSYVFRVAAINALGTGEYSETENFSFQPWTDVPGSDQLTLILASTFGAIIVVVLLIVIILIIRCRKFKNNKQVPFSIVSGGRASPDMELATLRELPRVTVQTSNALYAINIVPTDEDVAALPHFRRDQLTLTKFLGSGAFGEVFEGIAKNILSAVSGETKVAVKTLRKGATDQEKEEFLKEALLMSNFKFDYILRLLGVCLDNDPQFIILELMEGGDLLSYLRSSRPTPNNKAKLNLPEMVKICLDVSMGCRYLEDMHFVHRDLAARNCLVSSRIPSFRVVKIGDFGLARDIYKNDYYRKEGEGLLPVRWMSPESLIDGVFTTQSDVWAFGVLMWEVLTLGQQPYPARTNLEVLHFVRSGGRLDRPENCPDDMYRLMLKCWCYNPAERPSFTYILTQLETFTLSSHDPNSEFSGRIGVNGRVRLPSLHKKELSIDCSNHSDSSTFSHTGEHQESHFVRRHSSSSVPSSNPPTPTRPTDHGYLEPVSNTNHRYLELLGSREPNKSSPHADSSRTANDSSESPKNPETEPCLKKSVEAKRARRPVSVGKDSRRRVQYSQLRQHSADDVLDGEEVTSPRRVRSPYRGSHAPHWHEDPTAGSITVFRDIAGRSVPQPPPKNTETTPKNNEAAPKNTESAPKNCESTPPKNTESASRNSDTTSAMSRDGT